MPPLMPPPAIHTLKPWLLWSRPVAPSEVGKEKPFQAWVIDRSVGGLCLDSHTAYKEGTQLFLLPANAPETTPWVDVEVRSCRPSKDGYELGCRFVKTPPWAILLLFG